MTPDEELAIHAHIWQSRESAYLKVWTTLKKNKMYYYRSLIGLVQYGNMICKPIGNDEKDDLIGFIRMLAHLGLSYELVPSGIKLKENSKIDYRENKMYAKPLDSNPYAHEKRFNSVGKKEADYDKPGWCDKRLSDEKKND
jgi:hypothetical protein